MTGVSAGALVLSITFGLVAVIHSFPAVLLLMTVAGGG